MGRGLGFCDWFAYKSAHQSVQLERSLHGFLFEKSRCAVWFVPVLDSHCKTGFVFVFLPHRSCIFVLDEAVLMKTLGWVFIEKKENLTQNYPHYFTLSIAIKICSVIFYHCQNTQGCHFICFRFSWYNWRWWIFFYIYQYCFDCIIIDRCLNVYTT